MGHSYGPNSDEYLDAMIRVDGYLEGIVQALPENTLIVITADHGMHETDDGGNHGTLTAKDMVIPIIFIEK
jgi:predicted AlkP superfamily pyrophosphatase or phosphodiesterase